MNHQTQLDRYKALIDYIQTNYKEEITVTDIENICFYSYRNINRIFMALHHETVGQHIKRLRLEKAAEYLKFSNAPVSDIAFEIGYSDLAAFSKAFKNKFGCAPSSFRESIKLQQNIVHKSLYPESTTPKKELPYEIEILPDMKILFLEYKGRHDDLKGIEKTWDQLIRYATRKNMLTEDTIYMAEILDDEAITETIHWRYHAAICIKDPSQYTKDGLFTTKTIKEQKYAKFIHKGSHESSLETYDRIYAQFILEEEFELHDAPTLEFYLNDSNDTKEEDLLTEIYIPIV
ncbi:GyrI-like domain-containing protein [Aquimarina hainanensis]|uniref:GyrI-like domain-containing protein n=1 Tax=Aquimarina hainanensis TaxID=1578017 RepID=A0ABW5N534_9FLAO